MSWLLWIGLAFVSAIVCESVARSKGHSGAAWFFGALVCWPVALIGVLALGNRKTELLMRQQIAMQAGQVDEALSQELRAAGLRPATQAERETDKRAVFIMSAFVAFLLLCFLLVCSQVRGTTVEVPSAINYRPGPTGFLGIEREDSEPVVVQKLQALFGKAPSLTREVGRDNVREDRYYYVDGSICGMPCAFQWWIGGNRLTSVILDISGDRVRVEECLREKLPMDSLSYVDGNFYYWCTEGLSHTDCVVTQQSNGVTVALMWGNRFKSEASIRRFVPHWEKPD